MEDTYKRDKTLDNFFSQNSELIGKPLEEESTALTIVNPIPTQKVEPVKEMDFDIVMEKASVENDSNQPPKNQVFETKDYKIDFNDIPEGFGVKQNNNKPSPIKDYNHTKQQSPEDQIKDRKVNEIDFNDMLKGLGAEQNKEKNNNVMNNDVKEAAVVATNPDKSVEEKKEVKTPFRDSKGNISIAGTILKGMGLNDKQVQGTFAVAGGVKNIAAGAVAGARGIATGVGSVMIETENSEDVKAKAIYEYNKVLDYRKRYHVDSKRKKDDPDFNKFFEYANSRSDIKEWFDKNPNAVKNFEAISGHGFYDEGKTDKKKDTYWTDKSKPRTNAVKPMDLFRGMAGAAHEQNTKELKEMGKRFDKNAANMHKARTEAQEGAKGLASETKNKASLKSSTKPALRQGGGVVFNGANASLGTKKAVDLKNVIPEGVTLKKDKPTIGSGNRNINLGGAKSGKVFGDKGGNDTPMTDEYGYPIATAAPNALKPERQQTGNFMRGDKQLPGYNIVKGNKQPPSSLFGSKQKPSFNVVKGRESENIRPSDPLGRNAKYNSPEGLRPSDPLGRNAKATFRKTMEPPIGGQNTTFTINKAKASVVFNKGTPGFNKGTPGFNKGTPGFGKKTVFKQKNVGINTGVADMNDFNQRLSRVGSLKQFENGDE